MKTEYTNQLQREALGLDPHEPTNNYFFQTICDKHDFVEVVSTTSGTNKRVIAKQCKNCGCFFPANPTPSSTVDLEREAEDRYPIGDSDTLRPLYHEWELIEEQRKAYIKGRQTTSQKGLEELIEVLKGNLQILEQTLVYRNHNNVSGSNIFLISQIEQTQLAITKATELLTQK